MFCTKCGAEIQEGTRFCIKCGNPVAENSAAENSVPERPAAENSVAKNPVVSEIWKKLKIKLNKKILFAIGTIAVILILVFVFKGAGAGLSSPEKAFEAYRNGQAHHEFDRMIKAYPDFVIKYYGGKAEFKEAWEREYGGIGRDSFIYEAVDHSMLGKDEAKEIEQKINDAFGSNVKFSAVATVDYRIDMHLENKTAVITGGYAVKYKGKWFYILFE